MPIFIPGFRSLREQTQLIILELFACLGILYLVPKVLPILNIGPHDHFDFQHLWLAGKIWGSGRNPYDGPLFQNEYIDIFHLLVGPSNGVREILMLYPPYWYPLVVPFGFLSFEIAISIWKVINFSLLIGSTYLIARALADATCQKYMPIFLTGVGFVCFMQSTAISVWSGQTSILVYFGVSLMIFGLLKERPFVLIVGMVFLALKPNIGIVAFAAIAALHRYRWTILPAAGVCLLASAPIAFTGGYRASIEGFLANLAEAPLTDSYSPNDINGLIRISDYLFLSSNASLGTPIVILAAIICAFVVFYNSSFNKAPEVEDAQHKVASLALFVAITFFFVPLHSYDLVSLVALLMMIVAIPFAGRWLIALGLLICFRPINLWGAFGVVNSSALSFPQSHLVSMGLFLLVVGAVWAILTRIPLSKL
jgi:hypothetical protein